MSRMNRPGKKNALLLRKEKLLEELMYCEKQIEQAKQNQTNNNVNYDDSSDSDTELSLRLDKGTSLPSLMRKKSALQTRCNATAELTGLEVLESTVNVLSEDPDLNGEPVVADEGVWREVIAECKVDLIPFTISFYVHQPNRLFGQPSYRCLRVVASKQANERELSNSVLSKMLTPSDAFEVIKSYAAAHRSRRSTLARLAEKYGDDLYMTPLGDGGYQLQCANILELSWTLESKPSTVAYFRHRMKLSLEYMDESYLKVITQANKEMSHPSVDTDERTLLLSKIISTCLQAQGTDAPGSGTSKVQKRPNEDQESTSISKKRKENEVMGPPTALPKKSKIKSKENTGSNNTEKENNKTKKLHEKEINGSQNKVKAASKNHKENNKNDIIDKSKETNAKEKTQTNVESIKEKNTKSKNPQKDSNKEISKSTNEISKNQKINKDAKIPDSTENIAKNKENSEKSKSTKDNEKIEKAKDKGKNKVLNKNAHNKEIIGKENVTKNINKENTNQKPQQLIPHTKRINLKPNIKLKNDKNKSGNTENAIDTKIKPINKRFNEHGNINREKINLQKTKIPQRTSGEKIKLSTFRMSPRTKLSAPHVQTAFSDKKTSSNIARLVKKPSGKPKV